MKMQEFGLPRLGDIPWNSPRRFVLLGVVLSLLASCSSTTRKAGELYDKARAAHDDERYSEGLALIPSDAVLEELRAPRALRDRFLVLQGELLAAKPDYAAAEKLLASPLAPGFEPVTDWVRRRTLGLLRCRKAKTAQEREEAVLILDGVANDAAGNSLEFGQIQLRRGACLQRMSRFDAASAAYLLARDAARKVGDRTLEARSESALGNLNGTLDRYDNAVGHITAAIRLAETSANPAGRHIARRAVDNLGWQLYAVGDYARALETLSKFQAVNDRERIVNKQNVAETFIALGDFDKAAPQLEEALQAARRLGDRNYELPILQGLASLSAERRNWFEAARWNAEAERVIGDLAQSDAMLRTQLLKARILNGQGQPAEAEPVLRKILADPTASPNIRWPAHVVLSQVHGARGRAALAEAEIYKAIDVVESAQTGLLNSEDRIAFLSGRMQVYREAIQLLLNQRKEWEALRVAERSRARALNGKKGVWRARANGTVLFYWLDDPASHLWVIPPSGAPRYIRIAGQHEIQEVVQKHTQFILRARDPLTDNSREARQLYEMLVAPAAVKNEVFIVPDGVLHQLNWETLIAPGPDHYWIEDATISVIPSVTTASVARGRSSERMLLVGDAAASNDGFGRLKFAGDEISRIAGLFPSSKTLREAGATPSSAAEAMKEDFGYIHFAAHASANRLRPLESAVILSSDSVNYKLYARDVVALPVKARLVTLSACQAAGARSFKGEGLIGFAWAFLGAGAENVVATLWEVDDASTPQLMEQMYRQLRLGRTPAVALREAKLALLRSGTALRKPYFWGAFLHFQP